MAHRATAFSGVSKTQLEPGANPLNKGLAIAKANNNYQQLVGMPS
jgi:hypothetical protein